MSNGKGLNEFLQRKRTQPAANPPAAESQPESESQEETNSRAYGANRTGRQSIMLDIRTMEGARVAFSYSYLNRIFFDASGYIELSFSGYTVRIDGRNLTPVYDGLINHVVRYVREENLDLERDVKPEETFISGIEIIDESQTE